MFSLLVLPVLLAQAAPAATPGPGWSPAPPQAKNDYRRFTRQESDGSTSSIVGTKRTCDCRPGDLVTQLQAVFSSIPGSSVRREPVTICGVPGEHLVANGIAPGGARSNADVYAFRKADAFYVLSYHYTLPLPAPDAETAMLALCP